MVKLVYIWFALKVALCSCHSDRRRNGFEKARSDYKVSKIGRLPAIANESSGLALNQKANTLWTHNDSGGKPELYEIDYTGKLISKLTVPQASNVDWEDLAQSPDGTLYIGDMGNNANDRRDLTVYTLTPSREVLAPIRFSYADQLSFPPPADQNNFDCEAFFYYQEKLYLFSKNRSKKDRYVTMYALPAQPGDYVLTPRDSLYIDAQVTSADVNPSGTTFALLTYGKILLFDILDGQINFAHPTDCIKIGKMQEEAIIFLNNADLLITNEQRNMFLIKRK
jgi:hypothetical protein